MNDTSLQTFASEWDVLEDTQEAAANLRLRSELAIAVTEAVKRMKMAQADAASHLRVSQPRLNDLVQGRLYRFSLDALVALAARAGLRLELVIKTSRPTVSDLLLSDLGRGHLDVAERGKMRHRKVLEF